MEINYDKVVFFKDNTSLNNFNYKARYTNIDNQGKDDGHIIIIEKTSNLFYLVNQIFQDKKYSSISVAKSLTKENFYILEHTTDNVAKKSQVEEKNPRFEKFNKIFNEAINTRSNPSFISNKLDSNLSEISGKTKKPEIIQTKRKRESLESNISEKSMIQKSQKTLTVNDWLNELNVDQKILDSLKNLFLFLSPVSLILNLKPD
ncbi:MAG: hypothetical protein H0T62_14405 [Parachlamydiaceae bacterium]|nr:hypothetical protein [Parachlamydiaceae bacterium]